MHLDNCRRPFVSVDYIYTCIHILVPIVKVSAIGVKVLAAMLIPLSTLLCYSKSLVAASAIPAKHQSNYAVIVSTSRYWFNYRHNANALSIYHSVKRMGIPDSNIILMLPDDQACDARNIYRAQMFNSFDHKINLYDDIEVDYRGYDVSVNRFVQVLTGRHDKGTPKSKRLDSDMHSNILVFLTGHGGDEFLKFQDSEEITSQDFSDAFEEMYQKKRYKSILFMADTCQANTLGNTIRSPNIISVGSSLRNENSYSWGSDSDVGLSLTDRFTRTVMQFFENIAIRPDGSSDRTLHDLFNTLRHADLKSNVGIQNHRFEKDLRDVPITDFFGSTIDVHVTNVGY